MPNAPKHQTGALALNAVYWLLSAYSGNIPMLLLSSCSALIGGAMPDQLEPADSPRHRGFWHYIAGVASLYPALNLWQATNPAFLIGSFSTGYFSHLLLDLTVKERRR